MILIMHGSQRRHQHLKLVRVEIMHILHMGIVIAIADIQRTILVGSVSLAQLTHMVLTGLATATMGIPRTIQLINVKNLIVLQTLMSQGALACVTIAM